MQNANKVILSLISLIALAGCTGTEQQSDQVRLKNTITGNEQQPGAPQPGGKAFEGTISGIISDSMCGANHAGMGELGKDPVTCTTKCVEQGAKYVLVDDAGIVYSLTDQKKAGNFAGKTVSVSGHIDPITKAIHVHSLEAK